MKYFSEMQIHLLVLTGICAYGVGALKVQSSFFPDTPKHYAVKRGKQDVYFSKGYGGLKLFEGNGKKCLTYFGTYGSLRNFDHVGCISLEQGTIGLQDTLIAHGFFETEPVEGIYYYQNYTRYVCNTAVQLAKMEKFDYNRWVEVEAFGMIETHFDEDSRPTYRFSAYFDTTGELIRVYIDCGGKINSFFKKYPGYRYYSYPWANSNATLITRLLEGDVFLKGNTSTNCGDFNAEEYTANECKCKNNGTIMFDEFAERCFQNEEVKHMFKYSLLHLSQKHINTQVNHSDIWHHVNNTNEPIMGQLVNNTGQSPPCRKITKVYCQIYGYRKMEACPSDRASVIKEFTNGSIYFKMQENIVAEFKGKLAQFALHCLLENNTSSQLPYKLYYFLLKFNGFPAIGSTKEEGTKKTRNIYWWILGILSVILVLLLASLTGLYIKRKREDEEDWVEMKRILETSITPTIYAEISNTKAIYQRIPDDPNDPVPLSSPFPKTGPLAYANFLNLDENNGNDTFPIHSPRKRAFYE